MQTQQRQQLEAMHLDIQGCMQNISEFIVRSPSQEQIREVEERFLDSIDQHFNFEHRFIDKLPLPLRKKHLDSHRDLMAKSRSFFQGNRLDIDDFMDLQYTFARHELEYDSDIEEAAS